MSSPGETTPDGKLTLEFAECLGACEFAPCMLAGDDAAQGSDERKGRRVLERHESICRQATATSRTLTRTMPEFEPVLLANVGKPDSHTLRGV